MRALLQRVSRAEVLTGGETLGRIGYGWVILLGIGRGDSEPTARALAEKISLLRGFEDATGRTSLSAVDVSAEMLVVSQFTLYADLSRGRRPGFSYAAPPEFAEPLVDLFVQLLRDRGFRVETGRFGASMQISLVNEGPFTIWLDSD